jgi:hypothetical protein
MPSTEGVAGAKLEETANRFVVPPSFHLAEHPSLAVERFPELCNVTISGALHCTLDDTCDLLKTVDIEWF